MISQGYIDKLAKIESSDNPLAKNPKSTAKGRFQFVDSTAKQYGLNNYEFGTPEYEAAEVAAVKSFTKDNYSILESKLGRKPTNGELYLAHQQGAGGAVKILSNPDAKAVEVLGVDQVLNNGGNENMTAGEFSAKWTDKFSELDKSQVPAQDFDLYKIMGKADGSEGVDLYEIMGSKPTSGPSLLSTKSGVSLIDERTGAAPYVRSMVGSVRKPEDRLATLQKYYPDAKPYGKNNFVFTHPETGKPTIYNPKGLDTGDIPSLAREAVMTAGSIVGGALGASGAIVAGQAGPQIATPEEAITVPLAASFGAGLGGSTGASIFDTIASAMGLNVDTRTGQEKSIDAAAEVGMSMAGEGVAGIVGKVVSPLKEPIKQGAKLTRNRIVQAFDNMNVRITVPATAPQKGISGRLQAGLAQNVVSASDVEKIATQQIDETNKAISRVIKDIGDPKTTEGAGAVIKKAAVGATERFRSIQEDIYEQAFDKIGPERLVDVSNVKQLRNDISKKIARSPETLNPIYKGVLEDIDRILTDASARSNVVQSGIFDQFGKPIVKNVSVSPKGVEFQALREIRTAVGKRMKQPNLVDSGALSQTHLEMLYSALTLDVSEAAAQAGPEAAKKLKVADRATRMFMKSSGKLLDKINKYDADERAFKYALSGAKDGGTALRKLRGLFEPEEWDVVSSSVMRKLGNPIGDGEYNLNAFLRNYKTLSPEARDALLGGPRYKAQRAAMDDLTIVLEQLQDVQKYANASQTAGAMHTIQLLNTLGGGAGGAVGYALGDPVAGAGAGYLTSVLGTQAAPLAAIKTLNSKSVARLMAHPEFVKWLAVPAKATKWTAANASEHVARLATIAKANQEIADAIYDYSVILEADTEKEQ